MSEQRKPSVTDFFEQYFRVVPVVPVHGDLPDGTTRFQWIVHFSLPFPLPSRECVNEAVSVDGREYNFQIHSHCDRLFLTPKSPPSTQAFLWEKTAPTPEPPEGGRVSREPLVSVAVFTEGAEYETADLAYAHTEQKIGACLESLAAYLGRIQSFAPFSCAWLVYPLAASDFGVIYFGIKRKREGEVRFTACSSGHAFVMGRNHQRPMFYAPSPPPESDCPAVLETAYELLAEALQAYCRGMYRLAVLNSFNAIELLANNVFSTVKIGFLLGHNVPLEVASKIVDEERQRHRNELSFLTHRGLKELGRPSLCEDNKVLYDELERLQKLRHRVAHVGERPTKHEALSAFRTCCEAVGWLGSVAGFKTKPFFPHFEDIDPGYTIVANDPNAFVEAGSPPHAPSWRIELRVNKAAQTASLHATAEGPSETRPIE